MKNTGAFIALAALGGILLASDKSSPSPSPSPGQSYTPPGGYSATDYTVVHGLPISYPWAINSGYAIGSVWYDLQTGAPGAFVVPNTSPGSKGNLLQPISEWNKYNPGVALPAYKR